jgi:hypothetical protein
MASHCMAASAAPSSLNVYAHSSCIWAAYICTIQPSPVLLVLVLPCAAAGRTSSAAADRLPVSSRTPEAGTLPNAWSVNPFDPRRTQSYSRSSTAARYPTAAKDNTQTSHGWPAAAGGSSSSSSSSSRGSVPRAWLDAVAAAGGVAVPAALGYEADDAVAALVAWVSCLLQACCTCCSTVPALLH